jgi:hypothetical protein
MEQEKFRKLNVDLPLEPITDDRPWFVVGLLYAFAFLIMVVYAFLSHKGFI